MAGKPLRELHEGFVVVPRNAQLVGFGVDRRHCRGDEFAALVEVLIAWTLWRYFSPAALS